MAIKISNAVKNGMLDALEVAVGTTPKLQIRTGAVPTNTTDADSGTLLAELTLPSDWSANASTGSKALAGTWTGTAVATGAPGHFRLKDSAGTTTHMQGSCSVNSGGGDLDITIPGAGTSITIGGTVSVTTFTLLSSN